MGKWVVTGATRGIGFGFVRKLLETNHQVFATYRNAAGHARLTDSFSTFGNKLITFELDISSPKSVERFAAALRKHTNSIDVLINNAGVYNDRSDKFVTTDLDLVKETFIVNVLGPMHVTKSLLPLLERGMQPKIINISSKMGSIADNTSGGSYSYRMSKSALNMFTKTFAVDFQQITTITMHPGWVKTEMGGSQAPTTVEQSVSGMLQVIQKLQRNDTGRFFDFKGQEIPW